MCGSKKVVVSLGIFLFCLQYLQADSQTKNQEFDVVITEIYADLSPIIGLPEAEYVELYNRSSSPINLLNWAFADDGSPKLIEMDFELLPDSYVILTKTSNRDLFTSFGDVIGLSSFPILNDGGDNLRLSDSEGKLIHQVNYLRNWHETDKNDGGWSLEMIDPNNTCEEENNWSSSINPSGGTPGTVNSIDAENKDETAPYIISVNIIGKNQIEVNFSETLEKAVLLMADKYNIAADNNSYNISNIRTCETQLRTCIIIELTENIKEGIPLYLTASQLFDCAGNEILNDAFPFIQSATAQPGNILINEILFDPPEDAEDFVELYNNSNNSFDLNAFQIADSTAYADPIKLNANQSVLNPKQYVALTTNKQLLIDNYNPPTEANIVQVAELPKFNKEGDLVALLNDKGEIIDSLTYLEDWHFSLLGDNTDGVSLERIDITQPSNQSTNWQSAAASVNYATPGYKNSQSFSIGSNNNMLIEIEHTTVSPDSDGFEDFLIINYATESPGWVGNIQIFDQRGRFVAHPTKNELLAESGIVKWDGLSENGERLALGIYIVYAEFFDLNGLVEKHKLPIVVAGKL